jgi:hypothetical protein
MKQPYRPSEFSVPLQGKVKEKYEPPQERYVAKPDNVEFTKVRGPIDGVAVYRTPLKSFILDVENNDQMILHSAFRGDEETQDVLKIEVRDGGLEKVPNKSAFSAERSFFQYPPSHYEKNQRPIYYTMVKPNHQTILYD